MSRRQYSLGFAGREERRGSKPRFAEFFAGIGLMRMGLEAAGWEVAWANDIDQVKYSMYDAHFRDAAEHFVVGDVHQVGISLPNNRPHLVGSSCRRKAA